jgi:1,4-dihydroxy-2-naphthoyl-CoA hydrolase
MIWKRAVTLQALNAMGEGNMVGCWISSLPALATMILRPPCLSIIRTHQPFGLLHGGASVVLAETLGSVAGYLCTEGEQKVVGLEVNANHIRSVRSGRVRGIAARSMPAAVIRCGRLISSMSRIACAARRV